MFTSDNVLRGILATIRESVLLLDGDMTVRQASPRFYPTFSTTPPLTVGKPLLSLCGGHWDCPPIREMVGTIQTSKSVSNLRVEHCFPERKVLVINATFPSDDMVVIAIEDVTTIDDTRRLNLEHEVARRDQFLSILSHELRNPLGTLITSLEVLSKSAGGSLQPNASRAVESMHRQSHHMERLIDDLLDVSRLTQGKVVLQCRPLNLQEVLLHAIEACQPAFTTKGQVVEYKGPPLVRYHGDFDRLQQVFVNLLKNSAKFSPEGGKIIVRTTLQDAGVTVEVADNGSGISEANIARIFDLFCQEERTFRDSSGGLGCGLTLARSFVEMHGGRIWAYSPGKGQGTTMTVQLPHPERIEEPKRAYRVLVVDDSRDQADQMAELIRLNGFEVEAVYGGEEALARIEHVHPDVILLDLGMPGLNGYDIAKRLGESPPPLIALTGMGQDTDRAMSQAAGFAAHMVKPVKEQEVLSVINSVLLSRPKQ